MEYAPLIITLKTAVVATVVTFFLGIGLALVVVRMRRFQGLADAVITLPLVLPPTVIGFFLLLAFGRRSLIGKFLLRASSRASCSRSRAHSVSSARPSCLPATSPASRRR